MPPPKAKKMTAQPVRTRHFVGKPAAAEVEEPSSEDESASEAEPQPKPAAKPKRAPAASSFPGAAFKSTLAARQKAEAERKRLEAEFETESEAESGESGSESGSGSGEESSEEEESSSEEEAPKKLLRPVFLKKGQRNQTGPPPKTAEELAEEEDQRRQAQTRALVQAQVEQRVAQKAKKKDWDDEVEGADIDAVDDTDGLDPEAEYAAWKLRELKRIRRARAAIEEAEAERAEIERRRNLTDAERDAEDRAFLEKQKEERGERGQMSYMQKYYHKGAFFQEDLKELGLDQRNFMGAQFEDATNREVLPEYMQIRDMTKLGKKGRTRYRDMKSEDTGRWGEFGDDRRPKDKNDYGLDDRFKSDNYRGGERDRDREGATGANAKPLGERKRFGEDANREGKRPRVDDR